jgi:Ca-activated chloride channel family protein
MVFVIDQTGSQSGWPIEKSKQTMKYALQHMNPGDTFQLIGFNTEVYPCFPAPVPNTPANVARALQYLEPLQGDGGTDILKSVEYALKMPDDPNRLRIVCYMTDGYVGNDMQILDYIRKNRGRTRMFPFGIGNSVNRFLIEGMAKEGRGASDIVTLDEEGQGHAEKFYRRIASPVLLDPHVDWGGLPVQEVFPEQIPDVFTAGPILIKGRYTRPAQGDVVVRGILRGRPWSQRLHVTLPAMDKDGEAISTVWAREKIEELQSQDWLGAQTGQPDASIKEKIVQTALDHRLMSQYTSFVAVEQQVVNIGGKQKTVDVPVEMPEGVSYDGIFGNDRDQLSEGLAQQSFESIARGRGVNYLYKRSAPSQRSSVYALNAPTGAAAKPATVPTAELPSLPSNEEAPVSLSDKSELHRQPALSLDAKDIQAGTKKSESRLKAMKPEDRKAALAQAKLDPALQARLKKAHSSNGKTAKSEEVAVQIWLNRLPSDGLKRLKALGFKPAATLMQGKLLLGTLPVQKLESLIELNFVSRVEPPKFK